MTDASNCGVCGHTCLGGKCVAGACQPVSFATGLWQPSGLVSDGISVYIADFMGRVYVQPVASCGGAAQMLANNSFFVRGIAADATGVYWTANGPPAELTRCALGSCAGGPMILTTQAGTSTSITLDGADVFFSLGNPSAVYKAPKAGGGAVTLAAEGGGRLATDATTVFFTTFPGHLLRRVEKDGTGLATVAASALELEVDATQVFWSDGINVYRADKDGQNAMALGANGSPIGIAIDATDVYWADQTQKTIVKCAKSGCGGSPTVVSSQGVVNGVKQVALDATSIYWSTDLQSPGLSYVTRLAR